MKRERVFTGLLLVIAAAIYLPGLGQVPFPLRSDYSDFAITHLPNALFLRSEIFTHSEIPLWSPTILSGYPFAANPLSGLWYPPGWLNILLPPPWGMNLAVWLHFIWLGAGMYGLLRRLNLGVYGAGMGAISVMLLPKLAAHYGAGHITLIFAFAWTPWLLLAEMQTRQAAGVRRVLPGVVMGLIFLADPRWIVPAGLLWLGWRVYAAENMPFWQRVRDEGWKLILQVLTAMGISAPLLIPLAEYTLLSSRVGMTGGDNSVLALPAGYLVGLVAPPFEINAEWFAYFGIVPLLMAIWGWGNPILGRRQRFWLAAALAGLVLAVIPGIPGLEWVGRMAGLGLLRVPSRYLLISGFALTVLAASGVENLLSRPESRRRLLLLGGLLFVLGLFAVSLFGIGSRMGVSFIWTAGLGTTLSVWLLIQSNRKLSAGIFAAGVIGLTVLDVGGTAQVLVRFKAYESVISENQAAATYLATQPGVFRVYSPSYSLPQQTAAQAGLQLADGVDPLQLLSYVEFMRQATGVPNSGYSVTLPPFANARPETDNERFMPDARRLGWINVKYIVSQFELDASGLSLQKQFGLTRIYGNQDWLPRAWVQSVESQPGEGLREVKGLSISPNRISMEAEGPGRLVLAEIMYPGWSVRVDGAEQSIEPMVGILRSVRLDAGSHKVEWLFQPVAVYAGVGVFIITVLIMSAGIIWSRRKKNA